MGALAVVGNLGTNHMAWPWLQFFAGRDTPHAGDLSMDGRMQVLAMESRMRPLAVKIDKAHPRMQFAATLVPHYLTQGTARVVLVTCMGIAKCFHW